MSGAWGLGAPRYAPDPSRNASHKAHDLTDCHWRVLSRHTCVLSVAKQHQMLQSALNRALVERARRRRETMIKIVNPYPYNSYSLPHTYYM